MIGELNHPVENEYFSYFNITEVMQIVNNKDFYESVEISGQRRTDTYNYVEWYFRLCTIQDETISWLKSFEEKMRN